MKAWNTKTNKYQTYYIGQGSEGRKHPRYADICRITFILIKNTNTLYSSISERSRGIEYEESLKQEVYEDEHFKKVSFNLYCITLLTIAESRKLAEKIRLEEGNLIRPALDGNEDVRKYLENKFGNLEFKSILEWKQEE